MSILELDLLPRFGILVLTLILLLKYTFFRYSNDRDSLFSFMMFGHSAFIVAAILHNVDISMGFAVGLFAIFSMLRYRTESLSVRNMTYLFLVIVVSLISSVGPVSQTELIALNGTICLMAWACETRILATHHDVSVLTYDKMKNLKPQAYDVLLTDLRELTGLDIQSVEILDRNYKNKSAKLRIHHARPDLSEKTSTVAKGTSLRFVSNDENMGPVRAAMSGQ